MRELGGEARREVTEEPRGEAADAAPQPAGGPVPLAGVALALALGAVVVFGAAIGHGAAPVDYVLMAASAAPLAAYARAPRAVLLVTAALTSVYVVHAAPPPLAALPVIGAVHTASRAGHRGLGATIAGLFLTLYVIRDSLAADGAADRGMLLAGWFVCAVVTGLADRNWQRYLHQTEQRALEAERTREEAALRRAGEERLRIARELHDSLTHSISIVKLQANVAAHLARKRGEEVPQALLAIQEASGEAMRELRATLDVLRADEPTGGPEPLVERARSAGLSVALRIEGTERPLPAPVERTLYRIVQEALTNAARHAGRDAHIDVRITYGAQELSVDVTDDGAADPARPPVEGTGLTGMRERVEALDGTLVAGPRPKGGFEVRARLPFAPGPTPDPGQLQEPRAADPAPEPVPVAGAER
ncbi:sensor histidine kinase [Streptomyces sp. NPDC050145]|uniref:sensor histidine kinase n=1 Tax=Streptomyces sp. NPDC050145 TaxID=3365602 RepID=UPI003799A628